ncbi:hypothetical protein [Schlesneria sp.]|uniref:hypothetical protein n=1 Tax=Schlesneria sp. TaxID=2762018 RepID=UPI002F01AF14
MQQVPKGRVMKWKERLSHEIEDQLIARNDETIQFDPALIAILVPFLMGLVKNCLLASILQQHRAINRRPDGRVTQTMRSNIAEAFREKHPDAGPDAVDQHVEASLDAFREASVIEITELYRDAQKAPADEAIDWDKAKVRTLSNLRD